MINTLKHAALCVTTIFMVATPAHSQAPTDAQRNAIRSACSADYRAHCASIPPGGEASLQCLQKNMSSLSSSCQSAVRAVEARGGAEGRSHACSSTQGGNGAIGGAESRCRSGCRACCRNCEARNRNSGSSPESSGRRDRQQAQRCAGCRDPQRLPLRLSEGLRRRADRRRSCTAMPGKEQGEGVGALRTGRQRGQWRCRACGGRCGCNRKPGSGHRRCARGHRVAADAAARGIVRPEVGMQRRRSHAVRRRCARRRPDHAMSGDAGGLDFTGMQGRAGPVRSAVNRDAVASACWIRQVQIQRAGVYSVRNARISWINRTDSAT